MTFVVDANVVLDLASRGAFAHLRDEAVAPPLLWPEVRSVLHVALWRGAIGPEDAAYALQAFEAAPVRERRHRRLGAEAWRIADVLGWAKTYDAEYLALASLLDVPLATFDRRMLRAADLLGVPSHTFTS